jgi:ArsR family transcriptional regulator
MNKNDNDRLNRPDKQKKNISLNEEFLKMLAARFKVMGDPTRLKILMALRDGQKTVSELVDIVKSSQANTSRHLQVLAQAGIVSRNKSGLYVYYFIADPKIFDICEQVCGSVRNHVTKQSSFV